MVIPSAQGTVTNVYRSCLSTKKEATIKITWSKTRTGPTLAVSVVDNKPIATYGMKGSYSCTYGIHDIGICWDFSAAKYNLGPEPVSDFYVAVIFDDEFGLLIGDRAREFVRRATGGRNPPVADFSLLSRTVQVVGRAIYSTRARFYDEGREHDIMIRFQGELELSMHVDERKVLHVRRLRWNFRGNETLFIDGLAVDVMWDLFQWLFQDPPGCALVLLQTRAAPGSRCWLEEGLGEKDEAIMSRGFSLLIQVS